MRNSECGVKAGVPNSSFRIPHSAFRTSSMLALTFQVGRDRVALDVHRVREVVPRVHLRSPAGSPSWLAGLFVHRGRVVPVVDLHHLTGAGECPPHLSSRIILVPHPGVNDGSLLGLLATQVAEMRELDVKGREPHNVSTANVPTLGPTISDGAEIVHLFDPDSLLPFISLANISATGVS